MGDLEMKHVHYTDVPADTVEKDARGVRIRWLITDRDNAPNFAMRHFEIAPGGYTPHHEHAWEHEVFILAGAGSILSTDGEKPLNPGDVVFLPAGEKHQFRNAGDQPLELLCLIPNLDKGCC